MSEIIMARMYDQVGLCDAYPCSQAYSAGRRLTSRYHGPLLQLSNGVDVYAVDYPRHPPKKKRLLKKWRKKYETIWSGRELDRILTGKIVKEVVDEGEITEDHD